MDPSARPPHLAVIDVGTNSIRLIVAEVESAATYRILENVREQTRLGEGLHETGQLSEAAIHRSLAALGTMKAIADGYRVEELRAIATSAVRESENGADLVEAAREQHGIEIEVIPADEEARLAFLSVKKHFPLDGTPTSIVDIGGGSLEVVLVAGTVIDEVHSLSLGAVRLTEAYLRSDPIRPDEWKALRRRIKRELRQQLGKKPSFTTATMIGSGGTFTTLAAIVTAERGDESPSAHGYVLSRADLVHVLDRLSEASLRDRRQVRGLAPDRADIIVAGAAAIERLAKYLGVQRIVVNERGIRDGLLLEMIARRFPGEQGVPLHENRLEWVRAFARKCRWNEPHCEQVAALAGALFDDVREPLDLDPGDRELLLAAAILHDIGYLISHAKHHKHSYHMITHSGLPGFSGREIEIVASVARYHRRAHPKKSHEAFARLGPEDRRRVRLLSGILRVADGLDRTHGQAVREVRAEVDESGIRVTAVSQREPEVDLLDALRKSDLLEAATDRPVEIRWEEPPLEAVQESLWAAGGAKKGRRLRLER
jgi:exopolyphosphatase/guanosine-5'-triphosphate,3'-diphosphate pyrophosphatase